MHFIEQFPWLFGALIAFIFLLFFTFTGILLVRKTIHLKKLQSHHDVAGFIFTNLGVLYAVLLGFTVVNVQARYDQINQNIELEASYLTDLFRNAEVFSEDDRVKIRNAIKAYTESVINKEWGKTLNTHQLEHSKELDNLWNIYYNISINDKKQELWYSESISKLNLLMSARVFRLMAGEQSLKPEMWTILILGGISIMSFTWLFGLENLGSHLLLVAYLAATTSSILFLIYSLDTAFSGDVSIAPDPLNRVYQLLGT